MYMMSMYMYMYMYMYRYEYVSAPGPDGRHPIGRALVHTHCELECLHGYRLDTPSASPVESVCGCLGC